MLDKEAQERVRDILTRFGDFMGDDPAVDVADVLDIDEALAEIEKALKDYRKLPEGKPPLLIIDEVLAEMERKGWGRTTIENRTPLDEREIQWDSDIKWYEG